MSLAEEVDAVEDTHRVWDTRVSRDRSGFMAPRRHRWRCRCRCRLAVRTARGRRGSHNFNVTGVPVEGALQAIDWRHTPILLTGPGLPARPRLRSAILDHRQLGGSWP